MGTDAASLCPNPAEIPERDGLVMFIHSPKGVPTRFSLTLGVINRASMVVFLVTGSAKPRTLKTIREPRTDADRARPAALVTSKEARFLWLLGQSTLAELASGRQ
jgi:6-phosphogluconolactonase